MQEKFKAYRGDAEAALGEGIPVVRRGLLAIMLMIIVPVSLVGTAVFFALGMVSETATVAHDELGPRALLDKYTWFKEAAAQCDAKRANIKVLRSRLTTLADTYKDVPRRDWPRTDIEQSNLWTSEVAGVTASYNDLAATYNAKMAEVHWRFANRGELPAGATDPLPREFKPYVEE